VIARQKLFHGHLSEGGRVEEGGKRVLLPKEDGMIGSDMVFLLDRDDRRDGVLSGKDIGEKQTGRRDCRQESKKMK